MVLVGYFSAKQRDFDAVMASAAARLDGCGLRVAAQVVQRRGVSRGGVRKLDLPYSSRTLLSYGKVREVAQLCEQVDADAVVFAGSLTERQRRALTDEFGRPAVSLSEVAG